MSKHTPTPWIVDAPGCVAKHWDEGGRATVCVAPRANLNMESDAERIVACVNACEGVVDPSVVPEMVQLVELILKEWESPTEGAQRGELIARLSQYATEARFVLARVKGKRK